MSARAIDADFEREVGAALLGWIAATKAGGWRGPRGALDYIEVNPAAPDGLVRDFVAWASGYSDHLVPGARDRMESLGSELLAANPVDALPEAGAA